MEKCNEFCREIDVSTGKSMFRSLFSAGAAAAAAALVLYSSAKITALIVISYKAQLF